MISKLVLSTNTFGNTVYNLLLAFCLLAKVLADFLSAIYLLNQVLKHTTNLIQSHCVIMRKIELTS